MYEPLSVQPLWMTKLPLQQQSVVMLAMRGHDGVAKEHVSKRILRAYRSTVLVAARVGRVLAWGEKLDTFMGLDELADRETWSTICLDYKENHDELACHFYAHLMHGAEVLAYKHPEGQFRDRWLEFYIASVDALHLNPESMEQMDHRLSDWRRRGW